MIQQLTERDLTSCGHRRGRTARLVVRRYNYWVCELWEHGLDWRIERDLAFVDELQGCNLS